MFDYTDASCPICKERFKPADEIVVCPDCGTPHHKSCYAEQGHCANAGRHGENFDWNALREGPRHPSGGAAFRCPNCGGDVAEGSVFCNRCGMVFAQSSAAQPQPIPSPEYGRRNPPPILQPVPRGIFIMPEPSVAKKEFDGICVADWIKYIGRSVGYYLSSFQYQDINNRRTSFTFSAMFFPWLYFLYRKVWWAAAVSALIELILGLPAAIVSLGSESVMVFGAAFVDRMAFLSNYSSIALLVVNTLWGVFAVHFFRVASSRRIRRIRELSSNEREYQDMLSKISGPSFIAVATPLLLYIAATLALYLAG
jgi:hypothetical protein